MREHQTAPACFLREAHGEGLELKFKTGDSCTLYYSYLLRSRLDVTGSIELQFSTDKVVIEGRHLQKLYDTLRDKAVKWIREADWDSTRYSDSDKEPFVRSIVVTPVA
jgi:hypothetical protein